MHRRRFITALGATAVAGCSRLPLGDDATRFTFEHGAAIASFTIGTETLYLGGEDPREPGRVVALDATSGDRQWDRATRMPGYALDLLVTRGTLLLWNALDLTIAGLTGFADDPWTRSGIESFPPPTRGRVAFLHRDAGIEAVDVTDGVRRWYRPTPSSGDAPKPELVLDDTLVAATWGGTLTGIAAESGEHEWQTFTRNIGLKLMVHSDTVLVGGEYRTGPVHLERLEPGTGRLQTVRPFDTRHVTPIHAGETVLVQTSGAGNTAIHRLDPDSGETIWTRAGITAGADSVDDSLVVAYNDDAGEVVGLETASGRQRWSIQPPDAEHLLTMALTRDWVYVLDRSTMTIWDRRTGRRETRLPYDSDVVGNRMLRTTQDSAYVVIGPTLYRFAP